MLNRKLVRGGIFHSFTSPFCFFFSIYCMCIRTALASLLSPVSPFQSPLPRDRFCCCSVCVPHCSFQQQGRPEPYRHSDNLHTEPYFTVMVCWIDQWQARIGKRGLCEGNVRRRQTPCCSKTPKGRCVFLRATTVRGEGRLLHTVRLECKTSVDDVTDYKQTA